MEQVLVVKVGTAQLCAPGERLQQQVFAKMADEIATLMREGTRVLLVSSGAIQAGREYLGAFGLCREGIPKPDLAAVGQCELMARWRDALLAHGIPTAQLLVTFANWEHASERCSLQRLILGCFVRGWLPIVNENDPVSAEEVGLMERGLSENDDLAHRVALLVKATHLLLLTDAGGVYTANPRTTPEAQRYVQVARTASSAELGVSDQVSPNGRGGMLAKLRYAQACANAGMAVAIAGSGDQVLLRFMRGEAVGTAIGETTILA